MLVHLSVENLGLIEHAELEFGPGFNVITGETGVGKSMLLSALSILRGDRARSDWIGSSGILSRVRGLFVIQEPSRVELLEKVLGIPIEEGELLVERELRKEGRHRCRINGHELTVALLREVASQLIEIHGQGGQLALLRSVGQLEILDRSASLIPERAAYSAAFHEAREVETRLEELSRDERGRGDRRRFLEHVVEELESAGVKKGEREKVEKELVLLEERDSLLELVQGVRQAFVEDDEGVLDRIGKFQRQSEAYSHLHPAIEEFCTALGEVSETIDERLRGLQVVEDDAGGDPGRLVELRDRFDLLVRLEERYHRDADELLQHLQDSRDELEQMAGSDAEVPELQEELDERLQDLQERSVSLHRQRLDAVDGLSRTVAAELADLGMDQAHFEAIVATIPESDSWKGFDERGSDRVEFSFSANPGEAPRPLREVASGGELSRVMLALKRVLADRDGIATLVFDEVDSGVGGRLGATIGLKLQEIAAAHQVLCATHLPQVAALGAGHHRVVKEVTGGRTVTSISLLSEEERTEEIAEMLRGDDRTERSLDEAKEMLTRGEERLHQLDGDFV